MSDFCKTVQLLNEGYILYTEKIIAVLAGLVYDIHKAYKYRSKSFSVFEDLRGFGNPAGLLPGYT